MFSPKSLAVFLTVLLSSNLASATDCLRNICVGMNALNSENEVVAVTAIKGDKVVYQQGYYSYEVSPETLSKQVPRYQDLSPGVSVLTASNEIGVVQMVFENGKAQYKIGYNAYVSSDLSPEVEQVGTLRPGTVVLNPSDEVGKVLKVFKNSQVQYNIGYYNYIVASSALSEEVSQYSDFKKDIILLTPSDTIGKVQNTFADGRIRYGVGYYTYTNKADDLSVEIKVIGPLSKNTLVMDQGGQIGTVLLLFKNEKVQYQSGYYTFFAKADALSPSVSALGDLHEAQTVIDPANRIGTIKTLFADGRIQYTSGYYTFVEKSLTPEVDQLGDWRAEALAVNQTNQVGLVKRLFKDGRIEFVAGYYTTIEKDQDLSGEVEGHPTYEKNKWYATDSYRAGKVKHFFENGKIQVQTTEDQLLVYTQLYSEISDLLGVKANSEIADLQFKKANVSAVFENGTVLYEFKNGLKVIKASAKLFGTKGNILSEQQAQLDTEAWLQNLARVLAFSTDALRSPLAFLTAIPTVVAFEKVAETKELLIKHLGKNPKLIPDPNIRKKVLEFLGKETSDDSATTVNPTVDPGVGFVLRLNNPNYLPEVDQLFKAKKIPYSLVDIITRTPSLDLEIGERSGLLSTTCSMRFKLSTDNYSMTASRTKKVFSLFKKKNPCKRTVTKFLRSLEVPGPIR
ncbi:MAG: hypothetical protein A2X86_10100 [Bdellovibrionales bacterium GWA2_49_15]|nr:MAG: hypothetical protein A2X86_10100 [Bdellovibrionales bacterium GWA2_49_15]HAZ14231.1 hypothetical protein [Bdellovibrionales bacterium]